MKNYYITFSNKQRTYQYTFLYKMYVLIIVNNSENTIQQKLLILIIVIYLFTTISLIKINYQNKKTFKLNDLLSMINII